MMQYFIWGIIAILAFLGVAVMHGSIQGLLLARRFRKGLKHPEDAYAWFRDHDEWLLFETTDMSFISGKLPQAKLVGPVRFIVPTLGHKEVTVYGLFPQAETSWQEFERRLKQGKRA